MVYMKETTSKQIGLRVFSEQAKWLEAESKRRRVPVAFLIRDAITEAMDKVKRPRSKR